MIWVRRISRPRAFGSCRGAEAASAIRARVALPAANQAGAPVRQIGCAVARPASPQKDWVTVISFEDLALVEPLRRALKEEGYTTPTPIQAKAIPDLLAGRDLLGIAQTGTGKTAAFALPILQLLAANRTPTRRKTARVLVLTPTRELA